MNEIAVPRAYPNPPVQGGPDLAAIHSLLRAGQIAMERGGLTHYPHPGDLSWWLFYPPLIADQVSQVFLWDDPQKPGEILGLVFISSNEFTIFIHPVVEFSQAAAMRAWAEQACMARARESAKQHIFSGFISDHDLAWKGWYTQRGYQVDEGSEYVCFSHDLQDLPVSTLPEGFVISNMGAGQTEALISSRAAAQYGAFQSKASWEAYLQRYQRFVTTPVYTPALDRVVLSPGGEVAAFCINWLDEPTGIGLFEPVGTHPNYLRRGLGKALLSQALRNLKAEGMRKAIVLTNWDNEPAISLYHAVGFRDTSRLLLFTKPVI